MDFESYLTIEWSFISADNTGLLSDINHFHTIIGNEVPSKKIV